MGQVPYETRVTRLLDWTARDKAWFLCLLSVPLQLFFAAWGWLTLGFTDFGHQFLDPRMSAFAYQYALLAALCWLLLAGWGAFMRRLDRPARGFVNLVVFGFGPSLLPLAWLSGLAEPMTGVILLGATITGFVLFGFWRVLAAFFVSLAGLVGLAMLSVQGVLSYAPMFRTDPISQVYMAPYYVVSQFLLGVPFVTSAFIICYMLLNRWRRREAQAQRLATTDPLTGVANRRALTSALEREYQRALRHDQPLALIMVDLDYFKQINDRHGHDVGDEVLVAAAAALAESVREIDMVGRLGGEEFVILLPETGEEAALQVAERCRKGIAARTLTGEQGRPVGVTASLGVCACAAGELSGAARYLSLADQALYKAKEQGRNRVVPFRDEGGKKNGA